VRLLLESTTSTNDELRRLAQEGAPHGSVVVARHQTAGRGRLGRTWEVPPGSAALLSILIRRPLPANKVPLLCLGAAVATARAAGDAYRIKWPNDVLAPDGRKVAGILAEAEWGSGGLAWAILGVGVNVSAAPPLPTAACLEEIDGPRDVDPLIGAIARGTLAEADRVEREPASTLDAWRGRSATLGRRVRIGDVEGLAVDLDPDGALRVRADDGREQRVLTGDVEMVARSLRKGS
jgi:BirA family biotin operon repressor/biotin-[acetyl-CoA-carboxylase] ligase